MRAAVAALLLASIQTTRAKEEPKAARSVARQVNEAFVAVAAEVAPSVVVISVVQKPDMAAGADGHPLLELFPEELREQMEQYFDQKKKEAPKESRRERRPAPTGNGSGVILRADGYILTNQHVVEEAEQITVKLSDGREFKAELTGLDEKADVAVIRLVDPPKDLKPAKLADSSAVRVGEFAIAIGAPFELEHSFTFGHVSAKGRNNVMPFTQRGNAMEQDFIQTDANINPGNSGGPLVNLEGEVIGINSLIRGLGTGIGFAIPSNLAKEISDELIAHGKFTRAWLGISIGNLRENADYAEMLKGVKEGVVVNARVPEGPAAKSDLKDGDVITAVDGKAVKESVELRALVSRKKPGEEVTLDVHRLGKNLKIKVRPEAYPEAGSMVTSVRPRRAPTEAETLLLGLTVKPLTKESAKKFGAELQPGVIITEVESNSIAAERGFQSGDIITDINHEPITSLKEFQEAMKQGDLKNGVLLNFVRAGQSSFRVLKEKSE